LILTKEVVQKRKSIEQRLREYVLKKYGKAIKLKKGKIRNEQNKDG